MKELEAILNQYLRHIVRIEKRAGVRGLTEGQKKGISYYTKSAESITALMLR